MSRIKGLKCILPVSFSYPNLKEPMSEFSVPSGCKPATNPPAATFVESWWARQVEASWSLFPAVYSAFQVAKNQVSDS